MKMKQLAVVSAITIATMGAATATASAAPTPVAPSPLTSLETKVDLPAAVAATRDNVTTTAAIGGYAGAATGIIGGCLLGAAVAGVVSAPAALLFGAGPLAGCVGGALLLGSTAALGGTAIGGLGSVAANANTFGTLLNAPPAKK